ncbi:MAG: DUF2721 domain-containing protein [Candidatus Eremiobacteraeota bacterium]|nr:DUF2721 domain-containing protein [Candidatus Eremiobacteraeota bacterium]MBV8281829.1 DUF2721 domain-containing protein [Candidatus Eremiobacteraeota bacterium]
MFGPPLMSPSLQVVTGMITPAILILAAGSLVTSTLVRIGRIVDNIRALMNRGMRMRRDGNDEAVRIIDQMLEVLLQRNDLARRALLGYYASISLFLLGSLVIALTLLFHSPLAYLGPLIVIVGGGFLFAASAALVFEVNLSSGSVRQEVQWYRMRAFDPPAEHGEKVSEAQTPPG